jgi:hypothetical protein
MSFRLVKPGDREPVDLEPFGAVVGKLQAAIESGKLEV